MRVIEIPTNKPIARIDLKDRVYSNKEAKYKAIVKEVIERHKTGQPILVGTITVETSYIIHEMLTKKGINAELLNAVNDEREAEIIALAGQKGAVTIATNMAGRGTDIKLTDEALALGGLCVIGTERHDSKRIDNQLRGRSGRQGDVGVSMFYSALDDLMIKKDDFITFPSKLYKKSKIENEIVNHNIDRIQYRGESMAFFARKTLLDYDNILSLQRHTMYKLRDQILDSKDLFEILKQYINLLVEDFVNNQINFKSDEKIEIINNYFNQELNIEVTFDNILINSFESINELKSYLKETLINLVINKKIELQEENVTRRLSNILLSTFDRNWPSQLTAMDHLRNGVFLRQYANERPLTIYKKESYELFNEMYLKIAKQSLVSFLKLQTIKQIIDGNEKMIILSE
jgi:preprotein translocase subunit SecA